MIQKTEQSKTLRIFGNIIFEICGYNTNENYIIIKKSILNTDEFAHFIDIEEKGFFIYSASGSIEITGVDEI